MKVLIAIFTTVLVAACSAREILPTPDIQQPTSESSSIPTFVQSTDISESTLPADTNRGVTVILDNSSFSLGETMQISIINGTGGSIWYRSTDFAFQLEMLDQENRWIQVVFSNPIVNPNTNKEECLFVLYEQSEPIELPFGQKLVIEFELNSICIWPSDSIGVPVARFTSLDPGTYRIGFPYQADNKLSSEPYLITYSSKFFFVNSN